MADTFKCLAQSQPAAATPTKLYGVPANRSAVVSTVSICTLDASGGTFRLSIRVGGAADDPKQYLFYDAPLPPVLSTLMATLGLALAGTDEIWIQSSTGQVAFTAFGDEVN